MRHLKPVLSIAAALLAGLLASAKAQTASPAAFYKGRTITLLCGCGEGGGYDVYARLLAAHITAHIPGTPGIVVQNSPGAGGFVALNQAYNNSPQDGSVIGLGPPTIGLDERLGTPGVHFKTDKFNWLGRSKPNINIVMTWKTSPTKTIADALTHEVVLASTGVGSTGAIYPVVTNRVLGTKFKLIMGYRASNEAMLAMQRGEAEGHSVDWENVKGAHPDWIANGDINVLVQYALTRLPDLKDVPTVIEVAKTDEQRAILRAIFAATEIGMAFFTTPNVPQDRVLALRKAFDDTMKDPAFLADANRMHATIGPLDGEHVAKLIASVSDLSPDLLEKVRAAYMASP